MTQTFKAWLVAFFTTAAFVFVSVRWFDRPIAGILYSTGARQRIPIELADRIFSIPSLAAVLFVMCGLVAIIERRPSKIEATVAVCTMGTLVTTVIKDQLKFVFGRTWPFLLRNDVYGFSFFQSGKFFESFPSGHASVAAVILSVVWFLFPTSASFVRLALSQWISASLASIYIFSVTWLLVASSEFRQAYSF
jgi:membrane-associated phospholipid phosphatase